MMFEFNYHRKKIEMDVNICDNIFSQGLGLMFGFRRKPLLFIFKNRKMRAIHSFFCEPFYAIWFDGNRIVGEKFVNSWRFYIRSFRKFDKLLEIPSGCEEFKVFIDGKRKV